jgi:amino acid adenylation domain-containing protein/non-ribosomal peptide synthase protein (TIGR01720 family)
MTKLLASLLGKGIQLWLEEGELCFRAAKGAMTDADRGAVSVHKSALIDFIGARKKYACVSFAQSRLAFLDRLEPGGTAYNVPAHSFWVEGPLDAIALEKSVDALVARHEALRTTFTFIEGQPFQVIARELKVPVTLRDCAGLSEAEVLRLAGEEMRRPFDLMEGPLIRARLFRMDPARHLLLIPMHHIVTDGWSNGLLTEELAAFYGNFSEGGGPALEPLPIHYADFAAWERCWLQGEELSSRLAYWTERLRGLPALELSTDFPRPPTPSSLGARQEMKVPAALADDLKALSRGEGATLFMTLLAAFKVLLHRYTGQEDFAVGSPVANRNRKETGGLIGFFVNLLVLRTDLAGDPSFRELLRQVRDEALGAYGAQDLPFELLVQELNPERDAGRNPLAQVVFALQNAPREELAIPGLSVREAHLDVQTTHFDMEFHVHEQSDGLRCVLIYSTDLFAASTVRRLLGHWQNLLEGIVRDPGQSISSLPLMSSSERLRLVVDWNDTRTAYPDDLCVHELFERQVDRSPERVALVSENAEVSYGELNARANGVARRLLSLGVEKGAIVGTCMERSVDLVVGLLGILKAGAAYLPIDNSYPDGRIAFMLDDAQAAVVLTTSASADRVRGLARHVLCLDADTAATPDAGNLPCGIASEDLAYVMYTSGSTGEPKGVSVPHRAIVRLVMNTDYVTLGSDDVMAHGSNCSFDAATFELWGALCHGARLVIVPHEVVLSPQDYIDLLRRQQVTTLFVTTALFNLIASQIPDGYKTVREVLFGGEAVDPGAVRRVLAAGPPQRLLHVYGPTENTTFSTWHLVESVAEDAPTIPIGRPISNTTCYVLDKKGSPVPIGVPGELYLGGDGLALGYHQRDGLTAERFIANPFGEADASRLYKTGDLVKYLPDVNIEFLGRLDHQVKIRGFRIELGEIESVLLRHPAVSEAVVIAREDRPGNKNLAAYVVLGPSNGRETLEDGKEDKSNEHARSTLRAFLQSELPAYMAPAAIVVLDALPLTQNGKIDRRALPAPDTANEGPQRELVAPRTPVEKLLAEIWRDVLGTPDVGVEDNFFDLGGDSILSLQILARMTDAGIDLDPKSFFRYQTIAGIAGNARGRSPVEAEQEAVTGPVPLTPVQQWFFEHELPNPHHFNQSVTFKLQAPLEPNNLVRALDAVIEHHDMLRARYEHGDSGWRQDIGAPGVSIEVREVDLAEVPETERENTVEIECARVQAGLNIHEGPLIRAAQFSVGPAMPAKLFIAANHLAVDAVSWHLLLADLHTAYGQLQAEEKIALPPKTTSFKRWAGLLADYANSRELRKELAYWLAAAPVGDLEPLPTDHEGGENVERFTKILSAALTEEETAVLTRVVPKTHHAPMLEVLLAALAESFNRWTGNTELSITLEGHGREALFEEADVSRTVAWFTSLFPLHLCSKPEGGPLETLKGVRDRVRSLPGHGIGFGLLRYMCRDDAVRDKLARLPKPQVSFNYLGQLDSVFPSGWDVDLGARDAGAHHDAETPRAHLIDVHASVAAGRLQLRFRYNASIHRRETIKAVLDSYQDALRTIITDAEPHGREAAGLNEAEAKPAARNEWGPGEAPSEKSRRAVVIQCGAKEGTLYCIPVLGGIVFPYYALAHHMGTDQTVYGLQDPAFDGQIEPYASVEEMANFYIETIRSLQPEGPYHLCGWSFGGVVAYEIARQLREQGEQVGVVGIIDVAVPDSKRGLGFANLKANISFLISVWMSGLSMTWEGLLYYAAKPFGKARRDSQQRNSLHSRLRLLWLNRLHQLYLKRSKLTGVGDYEDGILAIEQPSVGKYVSLFRANSRAFERFVPKPYLGPVTVIKASQKLKTGMHVKPAYGWEELAPDACIDVHVTSGNHFTIMRNPKVKDVSKILRKAIENACDPRQ